MVNTQVDTKRLKDTGHDIVALSMEYSEVINAIYDKINGYSQADIWVGPSAENYIQLVSTEKTTYDAVGRIINSYGKTLIEHAENYEGYIEVGKYDG